MTRTKVGGLRSAVQAEAPEETALPVQKEGRFQYRSKNANYLLALTRHVRKVGPDGEAQWEPRMSEADSRLDQVRFEDHNFETEDPEVAKLIESRRGFGLGQEFWNLADEMAAHDVALESELRARIEARPDIAKRVLRPSEGDEGFTVPQVS